MDKLGELGTNGQRENKDGKEGKRTTWKCRREVRDNDRGADSAWKHIAAGLDRLLVKVHQTGVFHCLKMLSGFDPP